MFLFLTYLIANSLIFTRFFPYYSCHHYSSIVIGLVYFCIPIISGYYIMEWAKAQSAINIGINGEKLKDKYAPHKNWFFIMVQSDYVVSIVNGNRRIFGITVGRTFIRIKIDFTSRYLSYFIRPSNGVGSQSWVTKCWFGCWLNKPSWAYKTLLLLLLFFSCIILNSLLSFHIHH
jgi:hypothetical protein